MERDPATLLAINRAAHFIQDFIEGFDKQAFEQDYKTQSAVLHQLMIIGEAAKRLSEEFRGSHPNVPWKLIAGMRDKLIHSYDTVDLDEVWRTASFDIPELLLQLAPLLPRRNESHDPSKEN